MRTRTQPFQREPARNAARTVKLASDLLMKLLFGFVCFLTGLLFCNAASDSDLAECFARPPTSARPWVYWFWMDGNVSREGITADLEAMQRVGIGGVLLFDVSQEIPPGPIRFGSAEWRELFRHAVAEAGRLGIEVSLHNAPGWSGSGGPWITPELSMQKVVSSRTNFAGPAHIDITLPPLAVSKEYQRDIATLAFPTLVGDGARVPGFAPKISASEAAGFDPAKLLDVNPATSITLGAVRKGHPQSLQIEFEAPFHASQIRLHGAGQRQSFAGELQISDNGSSFRTVREFRDRRGELSLEFEEVSARFFRLQFTEAQPAALQFSELEMAPTFQIASYQLKSGIGRGTWPATNGGAVPAYGVIAPERIIDLTTNVSSQGRLVWDLPDGLWTILRLGVVSTGRENHPARPGGQGLECDKLSSEAITSHFNAWLGPLIADAGPAAGHTLTGAHVDSWEIGFQNWTPRFREEFRNRRGYDPLLWLPAFTGRIVGDRDRSDRFLWDVRRTIGDLVADNYAGKLAGLVREHGLRLSIEGYGNGPFDSLQYGGRADMPMSEFWAEPEDYSRFHVSKSMASAAHVYGKPIVAAEAFTAKPADARWLNHPFSLKPLADAAFCEGVNRLVFHRFAHQPWLDRQPGMTMGPWGIHYDRTETWWEQSRAWHEYVARCQTLLQSGQFVADVCYLTPEGAYTEPTPRERLQPPLPPGYDYDLITAEVVLRRMTVAAHRLVLPEGQNYRVMVLPSSDRMTPALLRKLASLVRAGATILGPPPAQSPSLEDFPNADAEVKRLAAELWGNSDGKTVMEHRFGEGRVVWGRRLADVLRGSRPGPDFEQYSSVSAYPLRWIHRRLGGTDVYFVANSNAAPVRVGCSFRAPGRRPELWHPDTGVLETPADWHERDGRISLPLSLEGAGSLFVVFREWTEGLDPVQHLWRYDQVDTTSQLSVDLEGKLRLQSALTGTYAARTESGKSLAGEIRNLLPPITLGGAWEATFPPGMGAPARYTFPELSSWSRQSVPGVKYFSGAATYYKTIGLQPEWFGPDRRLILDLGRVQMIAEVRWNGKDLGVLWKPPFALDVTDWARAGENELEVKVVNLWPNRLIGDGQLPDDCQWRGDGGSGGQALLEWPKWLLEGKPSPTGRITFTTWKLWTKNDPLLESGLLGPVTLRMEGRITLE